MVLVGFLTVILSLAVLVGWVFLMRWLGAWMLRINEVIKELKKINKSIIENKCDKCNN